MVDLSVKIGSVGLKNPIMPASGAFSTDIAQVVDINRLGALVAKTVSREYRIGNPPPRVAELECGMINSIGLPTKGIGYFLDHQVPDYARFTPPLVASITAVTADDFEAMTREVSAHPDVDVIEVNISCPTRNPNGGNFAMHEDHTHNVTKRIRGATNKPVWVKLSPNAGDVTAIAMAAESAGADALVVSNTILGLKINIDTFRPAIGNKFGGISGPGVKPIIMRMVIGLTPGPEMPPNLLPMAGRKVSMLIFNPRMVFETTSASAPADSAAIAMAVTSPALGESFTHTGLFVAPRMRLVTLWV